MSLFEHAGKPRGLMGRLMLTMMNIGHSAMAKWGLSFLSIPEDAVVLD